MFKKSILVVFCLAAIGGLVSCNGTSSGGGTIQPPPAITIAFPPAPPQSLSVVATATFAADVSNDSLNLGVDWVLNCSASACGSLVTSTTTGTTVHTASGGSITYDPPANLSANTQTVYIAAFSSADN